MFLTYPVTMGDFLVPGEDPPCLPCPYLVSPGLSQEQRPGLWLSLAALLCSLLSYLGDWLCLSHLTFLFVYSN